MALKVFWSVRADKKFDRILEYLSMNWGEQVTESFVKKVYDFLDLIREYPEIGSLENREKNIRGFVIVEQITIFYTVRGDKVILLDFFDNRQKPNKKRF